MTFTRYLPHDTLVTLADLAREIAEDPYLNEAEHVQGQLPGSTVPNSWCGCCDAAWPCPTRRLVDAVREVEG